MLILQLRDPASQVVDLSQAVEKLLLQQIEVENCVATLKPERILAVTLMIQLYTLILHTQIFPQVIDVGDF